MTWTEEDGVRLRNAIASGVLRVKYSDREVEYPGLARLLERTSMNALTKLKSLVARNTRSYDTASKDRRFSGWLTRMTGQHHKNF
jgi:hypothetical protein